MKKYQRHSVPGSVWRNPLHFFAFGFGAGAVPFAPGTFGTLVAIPLYALLEPLGLPIYLSVAALLLIAGIAICHVTARDIGVHDHSGIVWDEIVGYLITMIAVPFSVFNLMAGFVLFRFFDIVKPWPIRQLDSKVTGGVGIMLDDVVAGAYAAFCLQVVLNVA